MDAIAFKRCVEALQMLYYSDLLSDKEKQSISNKINSKFKIKDAPQEQPNNGFNSDQSRLISAPCPSFGEPHFCPVENENMKCGKVACQLDISNSKKL